MDQTKNPRTTTQVIARSLAADKNHQTYSIPFQIIEPESEPGTAEMPRRRLSLQVPRSYNTLGVNKNKVFLIE